MSTNKAELFHCDFCTLDSQRAEGDRTITIMDDRDKQHTHQMQVCHFCYSSDTFSACYYQWDDDAIQLSDDYWMPAHVADGYMVESDRPKELTPREIQERLVNELRELIEDDKTAQFANLPLLQQIPLLRAMLEATLETEKKVHQEFLDHYEMNAEEKDLLAKFKRLTVEEIADDLLREMKKQGCDRFLDAREFNSLYETWMFPKDIQDKVKQAGRVAFARHQEAIVPDFVKQETEEELAKRIAEWCFAKKYPPSSVWQYAFENKIETYRFPQPYQVKFEASVGKARLLVQQMREKTLQEKETREKEMLPRLIEECGKWVLAQGSKRLTRDGCNSFLAQKDLMLSKSRQDELYAQANALLAAGKIQRDGYQDTKVEAKRTKSPPPSGKNEQKWVVCPHCKATFKGAGGFRNHLRIKHPAEFDAKVVEEANAWRDTEIRQINEQYEMWERKFEEMDKKFLSDATSPADSIINEKFLSTKKEDKTQRERDRTKQIARVEKMCLIRIASSRLERFEKQGDKEGALGQLQLMLQIWTELGYKDWIKRTEDQIAKLRSLDVRGVIKPSDYGRIE